jgi:hypothetical protein
LNGFRIFGFAEGVSIAVTAIPKNGPLEASVYMCNCVELLCVSANICILVYNIDFDTDITTSTKSSENISEILELPFKFRVAGRVQYIFNV